jgi:hypothetical protein
MSSDPVPRSRFGLAWESDVIQARSASKGIRSTHRQASDYSPAAPVVSFCRCSFFAGNSITTSSFASGS